MYSRREFGKLALAGLPLSVAFAKINSEFGGVREGHGDVEIFQDQPR